MSLSPATSNDYDQPNGNKRRRTASFVAGAAPASGPAVPNGPARSEMGSPTESASGLAAPPTPAGTAHIPKRGARACTNCRKGKNRCEGEVSTPSSSSSSSSS
ncbi:hypothetical protein OH77DRAFT_1589675 [Trametes cingulata]|nr:hypothetical protein OH77DRAFT_1589675 [Trametes cingulata]